LLFLDLDLVEPDGLRRVVLEHNLFLLLVVVDLRRDGHLADAFPVLAHANLYQAERIIDGARLVARFPHADVAIGCNADAVAAVFAGRLIRVVEDPTESRIVRVRSLPARNADPPM